MAQYDFIQVQKVFYSSYWDFGIYGNYFCCPPDKVEDVLKLNVQAYQEIAQRISLEEIERAKRKIYN